MANGATAVYLFNGAIIRNISNVSMTPEGMESERMRGVNASRKAFGWRHNQVPGTDFSFETVVEADGLEIDWTAKKAAKEEFTFSEQGDAWTRNCIKSIVQTVSSATGEDGTPVLSINCSCLYETWE